MSQGKYNFDEVKPDPNRQFVAPLKGLGIPVGTIRTRIKEKQFCECETPVLRDNSVRVFIYVEGTGAIEVQSCKGCGLPLKP